ncbi:hypothetical protein GCM10010372_51370 [Streptomyces tauricus]|nr:hypothetical protein GCM10010372_51370 [Streptomyces tauricus]
MNDLTGQGQREDGDPDILIVLDAGHDAPRMAYLPTGLPIEVLGRMRSDRVMRRPRPTQLEYTLAYPQGGRPPKHGKEFRFDKPDTWPGPTRNIRGTGRRWSATSATDTSKPGGLLMPAWPATAPTLRAAWWWPPLIRACCREGTWFLATNLPHPDAPHAATGPHPPAGFAEIMRLYGLRPWIERSYKQIKDELGWADFQVRSARAIRRHQTPVNCAFSFCWDRWFAQAGPLDAAAPDPRPDDGPERGLNRTPPAPTALLARGLTGRPLLAHPRHHPQPVVVSLDGQGPTLRAPGPDRLGCRRTRS